MKNSPAYSVNEDRLEQRINDGFDPYKTLGVNIFATEAAISQAAAKKEQSPDAHDAELILKNKELKALADKKLGHDKKRNETQVVPNLDLTQSNLYKKKNEEESFKKDYANYVKDGMEPHEILMVDKNASTEEKKEAYQKLKNIFQHDETYGKQVKPHILNAYRTLVPEEERTKNKENEPTKNSTTLRGALTSQKQPPHQEKKDPADQTFAERKALFSKQQHTR